MFIKYLLYIFTYILIVFISSFIFSVFVMLLWNWLMPVIFKLPNITWIQAWGINLLFGMLFSRININNSK